MDNSRVCPMSMVSKTSYSHFSDQGSYYTHAWTNFTMKSWAEFLEPTSVNMHGPKALREANSTTVHGLTVSVCEQPVLTCHGPQSHLVEPSSWLDSEGSITTFTRSIRALARVKFEMYVHHHIRSFNLTFWYMASHTYRTLFFFGPSSHVS